MELRHLRYFKEVADTGSFTRAAQNLSMAQPPLSRQIQDLEAELGVKLFVRHHHYLELTPEGEIFLKRTEEILALTWKAIKEVRHEGK